MAFFFLESIFWKKEILDCQENAETINLLCKIRITIKPPTINVERSIASGNAEEISICKKRHTHMHIDIYYKIASVVMTL